VALPSEVYSLTVVVFEHLVRQASVSPIVSWYEEDVSRCNLFLFSNSGGLMMQRPNMKLKN
jgi:hypothetical protein